MATTRCHLVHVAGTGCCGVFLNVMGLLSLPAVATKRIELDTDQGVVRHVGRKVFTWFGPAPASDMELPVP